MTSSSKSIGCFVSGSVRVVEYPLDIDTSDSFYNNGNPDLINLTDLDPTSDVGNEYNWKNSNIRTDSGYAVQGVYSTSPSGFAAIINNSKNTLVDQKVTFSTYYYGDYNNKTGILTRVKPVGPSGNAHGGWLFCLDNGESRLYRKSNETNVISDWDVLEASGVSMIQQLSGVSQYGYASATYKVICSGEYLQFYYDPDSTNQLLIEHQSNRYMSDEYTGHGLYIKNDSLADTIIDTYLSPYIMYSAKETEYWTEGPASGIPLYTNGIGFQDAPLEAYIYGIPENACRTDFFDVNIYTSDDFNRGEDLLDLGMTNLVPTSNEGTSKDWKEGNFEVYSNAARQTSFNNSPNPSGRCALILTDNYEVQDISSYLNYYHGDYSNSIGLITRCEASGEFGGSKNGWLFAIEDGVYKLYGRAYDDSVSANFTDLISQTEEEVPLYNSISPTLRMVASGEYIKCYADDVLKFDHVSSRYYSTANKDVGVYISDNIESVGYNELSIYNVIVKTGQGPEYIYCHPGSGFPLYTLSIGTASQSRTLYTKSSMHGSGQFPLYMAGHIQSYSGVPLYTVSIGDSSGLFPLHVVGSETSASGFPTFIEGMIQSSGAIPLYIINQPTTTNIALYIHDLHEPVNKSVPLYLYNSATNKAMDLVVWGYTNNPNSTDSAVPVNGTFALFTDGGGVDKSVPLYTICGTGEFSNELQLYITANESASGVFPLFMDSYDSHVKTLRCYSHGW